MFTYSNVAREFETGNPSIISGRSGVELAQEIITKANPRFILPKPTFSLSRSVEYWAGWSLA